MCCKEPKTVYQIKYSRNCIHKLWHRSDKVFLSYDKALDYAESLLNTGYIKLYEVCVLILCEEV